ncbi:MAG: transcriptional regulator [Thermoplasmata archaeon]
MERTRENTIERVRQSLERSGFYVSDAHGIRPSSFDLAARRDSTLLLVKVLKNIDALDAGEARRLLELGALFPATALVIGQCSGASKLEAGVVYNRYGVPILAEETLQEYLDKALPPFLFSSPGGIFARIDGPRLRSLRESRQLSLGALASVAGVSRRTIQLYEDGAGAEVDVVERIESFLGEPIAIPIDIFRHVTTAVRSNRDLARQRGEPPSGTTKRTGGKEREHERPSTGDSLRDGVFRQLDGMGWEVVVTIRCPFDALTKAPAEETPPELLLTGVGSLRTAQHRAEVLHQLARVTEGHALFVVRDSVSRTSVDGMPIVTVTELRRRRDRDELLDLITEREGS